MKRFSALAATTVFAATLLSATPAAAFTCIQSSCPAWCETAPYGITIASADLGDETTVSETRRGMDLWSTVSCVSLVTNYTGRSGATAGNGDGQSVVGWVESGWGFDSNAIGVTGPRWNSRNCIVEADMQMNGVNFTWITGAGSGSQVNAFSIVLHEGGHYYGLGHSSDRNATMYFAYTGGIDTMGTDDENGICNLYPGGGGGPTDPPPDCSTTGCPTGQECVSGSCLAMTGDGTVCAPCSNSSECGGSNDFCLGYPDGAGYCGSLCSTSSDCGADGQCVDVGGLGQCIRIVGSQPSCAGAAPTGCTTDSDCSATQTCDTGTGGCVARPTGGAGLGEPCAVNEDCNSTLCAALATGSVCSQSCDGLDSASCPGSFYCDGEAVGVCGTGLCLTGAAGAAELGASCTADTDCSTLMCDRGTCATPCIPGGATSCAAGFTCQTGAAAGCGACKVAGGIGSACDVSDDCASSLCATRDGDAGSFCTGICTSAEDCPRSFTCDSVGDVSICVPPVGTDLPPTPGSVGAACTMSTDCNSGLCTTDNFCTDVCTGDECPSGYVCEATTDGITRVCTPIARPTSRGGCGCAVPASLPVSGRGAVLLLLGFVALAWRRRR